VLGLPTGRTPVGLYERVVAACARRYHCFRDVTTFNLDEYAGIPGDHPGSYCTFMKRHLFDHVDLDPRRTHIPRGDAADLEAECARYEEEIRAAGGLGLTFLGLGANGHIAFNEPGTPFGSQTHVAVLSEETRRVNADLFAGGGVPTHAITIGIGTILDSASIVLLASGDNKRTAIERLRSREIGEDFPASALWLHEEVRVLAAGPQMMLSQGSNRLSR
jgi:glucosamine-6-phosphate deaminase